MGIELDELSDALRGFYLKKMEVVEKNLILTIDILGVLVFFPYGD